MITGVTSRSTERRRLVRRDRLSARLAELHQIRALLERTAALVDAGWVQSAWFSALDGGRQVRLDAHEVHRAVDRPVTGVCLVGGVDLAGAQIGLCRSSQSGLVRQ